MKGGCDAAALVRPHLREMRPYTPILPFEVLSRQLGREPEDIVKLDANENPYGPPPEVRGKTPKATRRAAQGRRRGGGGDARGMCVCLLPSRGGRRAGACARGSGTPGRAPALGTHHTHGRAARAAWLRVAPRGADPTPPLSMNRSQVLEALGAMRFPEIYPDPECRDLRALLAEECGVDPELLLVGCGADELIDLLMRVVLEPGDVVVDTPPTFTMYAFDADVNAAKVETVVRRPDFSVDVEGVKAAVERTGAKMVFLTSPNNPDGSVMAEEDILELLQMPCIVVLDEAYVEFGDAASRIKWVEEYSNLVVLRTFSKRAGLAGLRLGYGAFPPSLAPFLWRAKQPYNVSVAAQIAGCAALSNPAYLKDVRDKLVDERKRLFAALEACDFLEPFPSEANFILSSVKAPWTAGALRDALAAEGVMVRYYDKDLLKGYVRISVGRPEQTDRLLEVLDNVSPP